MNKLYISLECQECILVMDYINEHKLDVHVVDINNNPPEETMLVIPALANDESIIAYGFDDIVRYFKDLNLSKAV